jgi:hypothetical protein
MKMVQLSWHMFSLGIAITALVGACGDRGSGQPAITATAPLAQTLTPTPTPTPTNAEPPTPTPCNTPTPCPPGQRSICDGPVYCPYCRCEGAVVPTPTPTPTEAADVPGCCTFTDIPGCATSQNFGDFRDKCLPHDLGGFFPGFVCNEQTQLCEPPTTATATLLPGSPSPTPTPTPTLTPAESPTGPPFQ